MEFCTIPKDEYLEHANGFKYYSKYWKNGKWHYIYSGPAYGGTKDNYTRKGYKKTGDGKYGTYKSLDGNATVKVTKGKSLFTKKSSSSTVTGAGVTSNVKISVGKLEQSVDAGKAFLAKLFKKKKKKTNTVAKNIKQYR